LRVGMPGESGVTVVTMLVCSLPFCTRGCGCIGHPAFPTPSVGRDIHAQLGRIAPRECEVVSEICFGSLKIESEAASTSSRTSERSERDPGPITTNGYVA
jgi:hypothetical protein